MNKPIGFAHEHLLFMHKVSEAGVSDHMLHHWLEAAYPELGHSKAKSYRDYWVSITRGEKQSNTKHPKLR